MLGAWNSWNFWNSWVDGVKDFPCYSGLPNSIFGHSPQVIFKRRRGESEGAARHDPLTSDFCSPRGRTTCDRVGNLLFSHSRPTSIRGRRSCLLSKFCRFLKAIFLAIQLSLSGCKVDLRSFRKFQVNYYRFRFRFINEGLRRWLGAYATSEVEDGNVRLFRIKKGKLFCLNSGRYQAVCFLRF